MLSIVAAAMAFLSLIIGPAGPLRAQAEPQAQAAAPPLSFEVASIKPSEAEANMIRIGASPGGRWTASGITLRILIQQAYDMRDYQISGTPGWASTDRYDIVAKAENPNPTREQIREMLRSLLAERFKMKAHLETKELPIYALVVGKGGHKLKLSEIQPVKEGAPPDAPKTTGHMTGGAGAGVSAGSGAGGGVSAGTADSVKRGAQMMRMGRGQLNAQGVAIAGLVGMLAQQLGRPVIDKTDLKGNYDFDLEWTPDETHRMIGPGTGTEAPMPADPSGPSIFTAVQEQLGLKLEAQKGPVDTLVIESVEKPSGN